MIEPPISYSFQRVMKAWELRYNFNIGNSLRCIYEISSNRLSYQQVNALIKDGYNSINTEIVELDMGFHYKVEANGNPLDQLFTPTLKGIPEVNLFYNPFSVFIAWFPEHSMDASFLEINMILYLIKIYSETFKNLSLPDVDRAKKMRTILVDILNEFTNLMTKECSLFIDLERTIYKKRSV